MNPKTDKAQSIGRVEFSKLSGSGNDFICIDNRDGRFDSLLNSPQAVGLFARTVCRRAISVGADGVIFACNNTEVEGFADLSARHFEPDGSEAELCGNGVACFTRWVGDNGWAGAPELKILTTAGVVRGNRLSDDYVRVCIPLPEDMQMGLNIQAAGLDWDCDFAITGVPHLVVYVDDLANLDIAKLGPALRYHPQFAPRGVNVNFVKFLSEGSLAMRTWEFGVEGETLACGTGSAAAALVAARRFSWPGEYFAGQKCVNIAAASGDVLRVYFEMEMPADKSQSPRVTDLCLETHVRRVYQGVLDESLAGLAMVR
jgi:diaminopimelate epimerase